MIDGAAFGIGGAIIETPKARKANRCCAHRAGLQGDVQIQSGKADLAHDLCRFSDHQHFRMGGWIALFTHAVAIGGDELAFGIGDDCADRHFAAHCGGFGFGEGAFHRRWLGCNHRRLAVRLPGSARQSPVAAVCPAAPGPAA